MNKWTKDEEDLLLLWKKEGWSYNEIALELDRSYESIRGKYRLLTNSNYVKNFKKWQKTNKIKNTEYQLNWQKRNKDKVNSREAERRAKKLKATPIWTNKKYIDLFYKLAKIEETRIGKRVHVDHIIPLQGEKVCGLHCENNLQLLLAADNLQKGNKYNV